MFDSCFVQPQQILEGWSRAVRQQMDRVESAWGDVAEAERWGLERSERAVDQAAELFKESITRTGQLSADWRKLWLSTVRHSVEGAGPGA